MAWTNANAAASDNELMEYQPLDQVTQVEKDGHLMTVDGQNSVTMVMRTVSKGRQSNREDNQTELSKASKSTELPVQRHKTQDLNQITKVTQMSTLNEVEEDNVTAEYDDQMPQLFSQSSTNRKNKQNDEIASIISSTNNDRPSGPVAWGN